MVYYGLLCCALVLCGMLGYGIVWCGEYGVIMVWCGVVIMVWCGVLGYDVVWCGEYGVIMVWCGEYGVARNTCTQQPLARLPNLFSVITVILLINMPIPFKFNYCKIYATN